MIICKELSKAQEYTEYVANEMKKYFENHLNVVMHWEGNRELENYLPSNKVCPTDPVDNANFFLELYCRSLTTGGNINVFGTASSERPIEESLKRIQWDYAVIIPPGDMELSSELQNLLSLPWMDSLKCFNESDHVIKDVAKFMIATVEKYVNLSWMTFALDPDHYMASMCRRINLFGLADGKDRDLDLYFDYSQHSMSGRLLLVTNDRKAIVSPMSDVSAYVPGRLSDGYITPISRFV